MRTGPSTRLWQGAARKAAHKVSGKQEPRRTVKTPVSTRSADSPQRNRATHKQRERQTKGQQRTRPQTG